MAAKTAKTESWGRVVPRRLEALRFKAERRVRKGLEEAVEMLPAAPRKVVKRVSAEIDRARHELRKRGNQVVGEARKRVQGFAGDVEKNVKKSLSPLRKRLEKSVEPLQKRLEESMKPLMGRLDVASRKDIERLQRRLQQLERRIGAHSHHSHQAHPSA